MPARLVIHTSSFTPRIDHLEAFEAGILHIQSLGRPQEIWIHPADLTENLKAAIHDGTLEKPKPAAPFFAIGRHPERGFIIFLDHLNCLGLRIDELYVFGRPATKAQQLLSVAVEATASHLEPSNVRRFA